MRLALVTLTMLAAATGLAHAGPADRDQHMESYLAIWADNRNVTPATVARLYAPEVDYYGHRMSNAAVYRDKLAFIRQWPQRRYAVVPGSVTNDCAPQTPRCRVTAVLAWSRVDAGGRRAGRGTNSVALALARQGGALKIERESGAPMR